AAWGPRVSSSDSLEPLRGATAPSDCGGGRPRRDIRKVGPSERSESIMPTTFSSAISTLRGGAWLLESSDADGVFTPERMTEEHLLIGKMTQEFVDNEVLPELDRLEQKDWTLARQLVRRCGDLGLLGVDVPEVYGGVGLDKVTSVVVSEELSRSARSEERRVGKEWRSQWAG